MEAAYRAARTQYEVTRATLTEVRDRYEQLRLEMAHARALADEANRRFEGVGEAGLGVARRLTKLSTRFPRSGDAAKRTLRSALGVKRKVLRPPQ